MKLVYLARNRIPTRRAHGLQIMKMCEAFAEQGPKILLVAESPKPDMPKDSYAYYGVKKNFSTARIPTPPLRGRVAYVFRAVYFFIVARVYLFFTRYDALYTRDPLTGLFSRNFILELHTLPESFSRSYHSRLKRARGLVVLTSFMKKALIEQGFDESRILVAPDGVDRAPFLSAPEKSEARRALGLPLDAFIVMYTGSFYSYDWKGLDVLLEASAMLPEHYVVVCVGGTPSSIAEVKRRFPTTRAHLIEHVPHKDIATYLSAASALILPNKAGAAISEYHTSPLKLFEYMASGVPIIASALPSIREVLDESCAFLVSPNDPQTLAQAMVYAQEHLEEGRARALRAKEKVHAYTWDRRAKNILSFIRERTAAIH